MGQLRSPCVDAEIPFETTATAAGTEGLIGQGRAVEALAFGVGIRRAGYNLFALGRPGLGKATALARYLAPRAAREPTPSDWVHVFNFLDAERPRVLELPAGRGVAFAKDMATAVAELRVSLRAAFESEEFRARRQALVTRFKERQERALSEEQDRARQKDVAVMATESGMAIAALRDGEPLDPEKFEALPAEQQRRLQAQMDEVREELHQLLHRFHDWGKEHREALKALDRETSTAVARRVLDAVRLAYAAFPQVMEHLAQVEADVIDRADTFLEGEPTGFEATLKSVLRRDGNDGPFRRYLVNVLVDASAQQGAPVVFEDNPTYGNLVGRVEHESQFGALTTHFMLIKGGAFHRARGGYLVLDALKVLQSPFAWEGLKRVLRTNEVKIESLGQATGLLSTVSIEPEPVPLGPTKVILSGDRFLYFLLASADPEFLELFKVMVDFEDDMARGSETTALYANLVATLVKKEQLLPFDRRAVARVIEQASRAAGDAEKLSVHLRRTVDLLREADFWAREDRSELVRARDVQRALDAQARRAGRARERLVEAVERGELLVATDGAVAGQVNGLAVYQLADQAFGHPQRITARVRLGKGELVDIEREVELGGPLHSKGVLILGGLIGARWAQGFPLSLAATLVFEQSYGGVEGDSASLAELCALVSALADLPARQDIALTGSVDQLGRVQPIGGVNEKVEGFFDVCRARGLTGRQGVIVPEANVKNLMLREDVVLAVQEDRFHVWAVGDVDEAFEVLLGRPAGARDAQGAFPKGSVNALVEERLAAFADATRRFLAKGSEK